MEVYLGTKDMDVVVYFYVNILLLAGYLTLGCGASATVFKVDQLFNFIIHSAENNPLHKGIAQNAEVHLERHFKN